MDLGRLGLFVIVGGASVYYGLKQQRISMMILGLLIAAVGAVNVVMQNRKDKDDKNDK